MQGWQPDISNTKHSWRKGNTAAFSRQPASAEHSKALGRAQRHTRLPLPPPRRQHAHALGSRAGLPCPPRLTVLPGPPLAADLIKPPGLPPAKASLLHPTCLALFFGTIQTPAAITQNSCDECQEAVVQILFPQSVRARRWVPPCWICARLDFAHVCLCCCEHPVVSPLALHCEQQHVLENPGH